MKTYVIGLLTALTIACGGVRVAVPPATTPKTPTPAPALRPIAVNFTQPVTHVHVWFDGAGITTPQDVTVDGSRAGFPNFPANGANPSNVHIRADGYQPYDCVTAIPDGSYDFFVGPLPVTKAPLAMASGYGQGWFVGQNGSVCPTQMTALPPPIPPAPTRAQALNVNLTFQGLMCHTAQFGDLHWFDAALVWLNAADRQAIYACKKAAGDTHAVIELPNGQPLYNECCNDYSPDRFPALDWSQGETSYANSPLADMVVEVRQAGFIPMVFPDERIDHSLKNSLLALDALQHSKYGDLSSQVGVFMTGWDGVFYGWEPSGTVIPNWAAQMRGKCPDCRLGIEFDPGHIPLGEGGGDYAPGGRMKDFDLIMAEFGSWPDGSKMGHDDTVWQIMGRLVRPYHRPPDQPANDDPNPPFYLQQANPRGPFVFCAFEFGPDEYLWVRGRITKAQVDADRAYLLAAGATCHG